MTRPPPPVLQDGTGSLTLGEFNDALLKVGIPVERRLVGSIFAKYDPDGSGSISYREFSEKVFADERGDMAGTSFM